MNVVQCWDDGVTSDIRLVGLLREHQAKATFNLNAGLHQAARTAGWDYEGTRVQRLGQSELVDVFEGFTIANHSLTHPHLERIPIETAEMEIVEGRDQLQNLFQQPIHGFAYPFGTYDPAVMEAVRGAGHVYARTTLNMPDPYPPTDAMAFHPTCHFLAAGFWERYEQARRGGVFYFWGHSYEMITDAMWSSFSDTLRRISDDPQSRWADVQDLFVPSGCGEN
ncbi:MAG: polysaccharide deacetylase family protein [Verrucomicrobia bacterium]|nr:polysaccharide deacetylase family protein [Verrucomicrobiota bacterium]